MKSLTPLLLVASLASGAAFGTATPTSQVQFEATTGPVTVQAVQPLAGTRIQGPAPAPLSRIKGVWRYQILLRSPQRIALRRAVEAVVAGRKWRGVDVAIDVDPINIL